MFISVCSKILNLKGFKITILNSLTVKHKSQACIAKLLNLVFCFFCFLKKDLTKSQRLVTFPSHHSCWTCSTCRPCHSLPWTHGSHCCSSCCSWRPGSRGLRGKTDSRFTATSGRCEASLPQRLSWLGHLVNTIDCAQYCKVSVYSSIPKRKFTGCSMKAPALSCPPLNSAFYHCSAAVERTQPPTYLPPPVLTYLSQAGLQLPYRDGKKPSVTEVRSPESHIPPSAPSSCFESIPL